MMEPVSAKVGAFLRRYNLAGAKLIVAVSGGPDSVCLLHTLVGLKTELSLTLHVAHLDHGLRGDSAGDATYVVQMAQGLGVPVTAQKADIHSHSRDNRLGVEEAARELRYRFMAELAEELGTPYIVTGHTFNDYVETVLLHVIRGTGLQGLIGLKPLTPWTQDKHQIVLVRPLLDIKRVESENYCQEAGLEPRLDPTNLSLAPLRNRIRLELLPLLREYNPGIEKVLLRLSTNVRADLKYLDDEVAGVWDGVVHETEWAVTLDKEGLLRLPEALQRHLLRRVLGRLPCGLKDVEMHHIESLISGFSLAAGRCIELPHRVVFAVGYHCYWLGRADKLPSPYPIIAGEYTLAVPGITSLPGWRIEAKLTQGRVPQGENRFVVYFDEEASGQELAVRAWRSGDRFVPLGLTQEKKLGEFMIAAKIPRRWRENIPLVVSPQQIIWLVGHRLDDRVKVTSNSRRTLRLEFKKD